MSGAENPTFFATLPSSPQQHRGYSVDRRPTVKRVFVALTPNPTTDTYYYSDEASYVRGRC